MPRLATATTTITTTTTHTKRPGGRHHGEPQPKTPCTVPAGDDRDYRVIELPNKLVCLLVSDKDTDKSGAAMDVAVGHFSDPSELPGLAHFNEHMLFLGTEKYPDENSYTTFLSSHAGRSNAFTSTENTNYYFDVAHDHLEEALDRFAQFFIGPLFTQVSQSSLTGRR